MAEETQEFTAPAAPYLDNAAMARAWAELPRVDEVGAYMLKVASVYGHGPANFLAQAINSMTQKTDGIRVFNTLADAPKFTSYLAPAWGSLPTEWSKDSDARTADEHEAIGGLLWPLPGGGWQFVFLMAAGTVVSEVVGGPGTETAPEEAPAPVVDDQEMIVAYANLPLLVDVVEHVTAEASRFGGPVARNAQVAMEKAWAESSSARVFNGPLNGPPIFIPEARDLRDQLPTTWEVPGPEIKPDGTSTVAGLIWPLPGSRWQIIHLMGDGTTKRETINTMNSYNPEDGQ